MMEPRNALDPPRPGFFKVRAFSRGPWVPARIWLGVPLDPVTGEVLDRSPPLNAEIDGYECPLDAVWTWATEIERTEWEWLKALWQIEKRKPSVKKTPWRHARFMRG